MESLLLLCLPPCLGDQYLHSPSYIAYLHKLFVPVLVYVRMFARADANLRLQEDAKRLAMHADRLRWDPAPLSPYFPLRNIVQTQTQQACRLNRP